MIKWDAKFSLANVSCKTNTAERLAWKTGDMPAFAYLPFTFISDKPQVTFQLFIASDSSLVLSVGDLSKSLASGGDKWLTSRSHLLGPCPAAPSSALQRLPAAIVQNSALLPTPAKGRSPCPAQHPPAAPLRSPSSSQGVPPQQFQHHF